MTPGVWILVTVRGHVSHTVEMNYFFNKKSTCLTDTWISETLCTPTSYQDGSS